MAKRPKKKANNLDRNEIRSQIFGAAVTKTRIVEFFGAKVELRQPTTSRVLDLRRLSVDEPGRAAAEMIVNYTFVPGTDEQVFETADVDNIMNMPFGADMSRMQKAITELTDIDVSDAGKN